MPLTLTILILSPEKRGLALGAWGGIAPVANVVLSSVRPEEEGQASGANNAIRELGGVFGVAVLASVFAHYGGYGTGQSFVDGLTPAIFAGAGVVAVGALAALGIKRSCRSEEESYDTIPEAA
jgi:MFS family permease